MKETIERERSFSSFGWRYSTRRLRMRENESKRRKRVKESLRVTFIQIKRVFF